MLAFVLFDVSKNSILCISPSHYIDRNFPLRE